MATSQRDIARRICEGQLHRLNLQMYACRRVNFVRCQIKIFEYAQAEERSEALTVGRNLMQPYLPVIHMDRADPVASMCGKIPH